MNTYLITWKPSRWTWDMSNTISTLREQGFVDLTWSCGNTKRIQPNDRVFLLKQGDEPRGIIASGNTLTAPYYDKHWDENRDSQALYIDVRFDSIVDPEIDGLLPLSILLDDPTITVNWNTPHREFPSRQSLPLALNYIGSPFYRIIINHQ